MTDGQMIHKAMIGVMRELGAIAKAQKNQHFKYNFRGIDAVYKELHPILKRHGIYQLPEVIDTRIERNDKSVTAIVDINYHFVAEDGSRVTTRVVGMGADTGDKATNKALSGAHKYALLQTFVIPCEGMDDQDASDFEYKTADKKKDPNDEPYTEADKSWLWNTMNARHVYDKDFAKRLHDKAVWESWTKAKVIAEIATERDRARTAAEMEKQGVTS